MPRLNITEARENLRNLQNQIEEARERGRALADNPSATAAEMEAHSNTLRQLNARARLMQEDIEQEERRQGAQARSAQPSGGLNENRLRDMLGTNEYARAFADAVRAGVTIRAARGNEKYNILLNALTIGGGEAPGEDGGFLVPLDMQNQINELRRELSPLADLFTVETVGSNSGWRVIDTAPTDGMSAVDEMGEIGNGDQPEFVKVPFTLQKYGLYIPVSNELASDEVANLFGYLSRWFAKKAVITENKLLLAALATLQATEAAAGAELKAIKTAMNVTLDPAISMNAVVLTNQTGFNTLDNLEDKTGRPLLNEDPKTGTPKLANGKAVHVVSNALLTGAEGKAPVFIGDFKQFATLFRRNPLEIVSTNVGGAAWRTDSIEVRGIQRMAVSKFDAAAAAAINLSIT